MSEDTEFTGFEHGYFSTACEHDLHDRCRLKCKFCDAPCFCSCHGSTAQAATGARAAGGESEMDLTPFADTIRYQAAQFRELDKTRLDFDHKFARFALWLEETADGIAPAAAPPTPSAPGVAELLAEARRRLAHAPGAVMFCDEIVRDLAPEGGQS